MVSNIKFLVTETGHVFINLLFLYNFLGVCWHCVKLEVPLKDVHDRNQIQNF